MTGKTPFGRKSMMFTSSKICLEDGTMPYSMIDLDVDESTEI